MKIITFIIMFLITAALAIIISANDRIIESFNFLIVKKDMSLSLILAIFFALGFILCWVFSLFVYVKLRIKLHNAQRKIKKLIAQLPNETETNEHLLINIKNEPH